MSSYKFVEIVCDDCEVSSDTFDFSTATELRAHLAKRGWAYVNRRDICSECREKS
jgi:hypothetical protein